MGQSAITLSARLIMAGAHVLLGDRLFTADHDLNTIYVELLIRWLLQEILYIADLVLNSVKLDKFIFKVKSK